MQLTGVQMACTESEVPGVQSPISFRFVVRDVHTARQVALAQAPTISMPALPTSGDAAFKVSQIYLERSTGIGLCRQLS